MDHDHFTHGFDWDKSDPSRWLMVCRDCDYAAAVSWRLNADGGIEKCLGFERIDRPKITR